MSEGALNSKDTCHSLCHSQVPQLPIRKRQHKLRFRRGSGLRVRSGVAFLWVFSGLPPHACQTHPLPRAVPRLGERLPDFLLHRARSACSFRGGRAVDGSGRAAQCLVDLECGDVGHLPQRVPGRVVWAGASKAARVPTDAKNYREAAWLPQRVVGSPAPAWDVCGLLFQKDCTCGFTLFEYLGSLVARLDYLFVESTFSTWRSFAALGRKKQRSAVYVWAWFTLHSHRALLNSSNNHNDGSCKLQDLGNSC